MKKIGIACDHAGFQMKEFLVGYLSTNGYEVVDFGRDLVFKSYGLVVKTALLFNINAIYHIKFTFLIMP